MTTTTLSSREFNQDTSGAKNAARQGPVIITDRGRPAHVLLTFDDYQRLRGAGASVIELLAMRADTPPDLAFEAPRLSGPVARPVDLG